MVAPTDLDAVLPEDISVHREIARGGQRVVYEVSVSGKRRVLKLMPETGRNRAEREVELGCHFEHPQLARILDTDLREVEIAGSQWVYFTETFIDGAPLDQRNDAMSPCEALRLVAQLLAAVEYLWKRNVVHRDIKPKNIMETPDGSFVLLDVGIGRHQDKETITIVAGEHGPGTAGYLSPEQIHPLKGRELDYRSDLFAIGIVAYEQMVGELPFDPTAGNYKTLLSAGIPPARLDEIPDAVANVLQRLMANRAHLRYRFDKANHEVSQARKALECS